MGLRVWIGFGGLALLTGTAMAEPVTFSSSVEAGWTSNATESRFGLPDFYVVHTEQLEITGEAGPVALRGRIGFQETRHRLQAFEDDQSLALGLEAAAEAGEGLVLRGSFGLTLADIGDDLDLGGLGIATRTAKLELDVAGEAALAVGDGALAFDFAHRVRRAEASRFPGLDLVPERLTADVGSSVLGARYRGPAGGEFQWAAAIGAEFTSVSDADQAIFGRIPSHALRGTLGAERAFGDWLEIGAAAGAAIVWNTEGLGRTEAIGEVRLALMPLERLRLGFDVSRALDLLAPNDGVASLLDSAEASVRWAVSDAVSLTLAALVSREAGLGDPTRSTRKSGVSLRADYAVSEAVTLGLVASRLAETDGNVGHEVTRLGLVATGRI